MGIDFYYSHIAIKDVTSCMLAHLKSSVVLLLLTFCLLFLPMCNCSTCMFCCILLYVHSSIAIILMGKRELVALLY